MNNTCNGGCRNNQNGMISYNRMDMHNNMNKNINNGTNGSRVEMTNKSRIIQNVYELGFVMTEALLYLDTHPNDNEAIEYYNTMKKRYNDAVEAYENSIGPLTFNSTGVNNYFDWAATPLPWDKEGC